MNDVTHFLKVFAFSFCVMIQLVFAQGEESQQKNLVQITSPDRGQEVGSRVVVKGTYEIQDSSRVWILIHSKLLVDQWWPQGKVVMNDDGTWEGFAYIGNTGDIGLEFEIAVATFDKNEEAKILSYHARAEESGDFTPVKFPKTTSNVDIVVVTKTSH